MSEHPQHLTIGTVAHRTGVSTQAIRYYERIGLLPRPARQPNGYRYYCEIDVKRVLVLARVRSFGTPLAAAKSLVDVVPQARCADIQHELLDLAHHRLREIDEEIAALRRQRGEVANFQRALQECAITSGQAFAECGDVRCVTQPEHCTPSGKEETTMVNHFTADDCDCCNGTCDCDCGSGCCQTA